MNAGQLSAYLGLGYRTVIEYSRSGRIPAIRMGRQIRFDVTKVLEMMEHAPVVRRRKLGSRGKDDTVRAAGGKTPGGSNPPPLWEMPQQVGDITQSALEPCPKPLEPADPDLEQKRR